MDLFIHPDFYQIYSRYPIRLIDIGAAGGIQEHWKPMARFIEVVGFEPNEEAYKKLCETAPSNIMYINKGLYDKKTTVKLHITRTPTNSSIFYPNKYFFDNFPRPERYDVVNTENIDVDTLDSQLPKSYIENNDFIKIDTQGSELSILKGAEKTLKKCFGLEVEVEFCAMYQNQPLFGEVDSFLRSHGFQIFGLQRTTWKRNECIGEGQLICGNALYLESLDSLMVMLNTIKGEELKVAKTLKAVSICLLYKRYDFAMEIVETMRNLFTSQQMDRFFLIFRQLKPDRLPNNLRDKVLLKTRKLNHKIERLINSVTGDYRWRIGDKEL